MQRIKGQKIVKTYNGEFIGKNQDGTVSVYVSPIILDRDKEVILPEAWNLGDYKKHSPLIDSHEYSSVVNQIGMSVDTNTDNKGLKSTFEYWTNQGNFAADWAYFIVSKNQAAYSVGFIPYAWTENREEIEKLLIPFKFSESDINKTERAYTDVTLLEISQVIMPANPMAIQGNEYSSFVKSFVDRKEGLKELKDIVTKPEPEVTENTIRIRVEDPDKFVQDSFRTITISADKGIKAVIGKYKTDPDGPTHTQSYIFIR